jgi:hypothetical protein
MQHICYLIGSFFVVIVWICLSAVEIESVRVVHSTTTLSQARHDMVTATFRDLVFFAGGTNLLTGQSNRVDVLNMSNGNMTLFTLSTAYNPLITTWGDYVLFFPTLYSSNAIANVYNVLFGSWVNVTLSSQRSNYVFVFIEGLLIFAGGVTYNGGSYQYYNNVNIYNVTSKVYHLTKME